MKKMLHKAAALLMLCAISGPAWSLEAVDGVYQIGSAADLIEFAGIVNGGETAANAVLTADFAYTENLTPIGTAGYNGTFDGQGHTITIEADFTTTSTEHVALFYELGTGGVIKNLNVTGTLKSGGKYMAGFVGRLTGGTISHCVSTLTLYTSMSGDCTNGGIAGHTVSNDGSVIEFCVVGGAFQGELANCWGGFVGWADRKLTIDNCMFVADVSGTQNSEQTWVRNSGNASVSNSIYLNVLGSAVGGTQVTAEQLTSGEACYILNGRSSEEPKWFQTLGEDPLPVADASHGTVYLNGRLHCNGTPYEEAEYSNTQKASTQDDHVFVNGVCTYCGAADPSFTEMGEDGYYNLTNANQLVWFASKVNDGNSDLKARLTAPIDMTDVAWTPIGTAAIPFKGVFDGQLFPLTNLNGMLFGTVAGAQINGVAIESGTVTDNPGAAHTGSIIGHSNDKNTLLTNSYSKAFMNGGGGDLGGISGKFLGTMKNVFFAGSFAGTISTWSMGGLIGSTNSEGTTSISDCFVFADWGEGLDPGYGARGGIVGWCHTNTSTNCYVISDTFTKLLGDGTGSTVNCGFRTAEEFASGAVAWDLNGQSFADVTWYQTLSDIPEGDIYPTLDPTHEIVYPSGDGYASAGAENFQQMRDNLISSELAYCDDAVAYVEAKNAYREALEAMKAITDRDAFILAYQESKPLRAAIENSAKAYEDFEAFVKNIEEKATQSGIGGEDMDFLMDYLTNDWEPNEDYPNGTPGYIMQTCLLDDEALAAEKQFLDNMWQTAQKNGYTVGDEITDMLVNANLADKFNGWEYTKDGSTFTTGGVPEVMPTAESWNATFDMHQTLTGLLPGYYQLKVNAAFRSAADIYSTNYAAWAYLNADENLIMTEAEDVVSEADAQDLVNCYINGGVLTDEEGNHISPYDYEFADIDNDIFGYVPYGPLSCSYAFSGGRYVNTIVTQVTDGTLTVGLKLPGTGCADDWMGFGNFRLRYLGDAESDFTSAAYDETLAGMVARANTILAYKGSIGTDYRERPEFSAALRSELEAEIAQVATATTVEQKEQLVASFAATFRSIYDCKKAYANYFDRAQALYNTGYAMAEDDANLIDLLVKYQTVLEEVIAEKWGSGAYTQAEAEEMADMTATDLYQYLIANMPDIVDGKYQIATVDHLNWLARMVNGGNSALEAELVAPIDLEGVDWKPIGTVATPFTGKFDGHLYPITNINNMLFGTITGAQITRVALESGAITDIDTQYAAHTGSIVGHSTSSAGSVTNSYSRVAINGGQGDLGGISGKFLGTMKNVAFEGSFAGTLSTWSMGGLAGSTNSTNTTFISDCFVFADWGEGLDPGYGARGGIVGWCHTNTSTNCFVIADTFTKLLGDGTGSTQNCAFKTAAEFASGEVAFLMNADQDSPAWFQTIGQDAAPVLDDSHLVVFYDEEKGYYNDAQDAIQSLNDGGQPAIVNVYDMQGRVVRLGVSAKTALEGLPGGVYVVGRRKVIK